MLSNRKGNRMCQLAAILSTVLVIIFYARSGNQKPPPLPPLPGTYQYFKDVDFHSQSHKLGAVSHCDARFALERPLDNDEIRLTLNGLLYSYAKTMESLGVETWMAHGTLLGWYWNQKMLPWDTDLDVQTTGAGIVQLAIGHNMTEFKHELPDSSPTRKYLLDINPHYSIISLNDVANHIDGRWIDTTNGKFIDITAVHSEGAEIGAEAGPSLYCKDGHRYSKEDIYPLERSLLEGVAVKVPRASGKVLSEEYGARSLTNGKFHWHRFDAKTQTWKPE